MKDYAKKLVEYERDGTMVIKHRWGQNVESLYNQIVEAWNRIAVGQRVAIVSSKKLGIKSAVKIFKDYGLECKVTGKGAGELRIIECEKNQDNYLEPIATSKIALFDFNQKQYEVNIGNAIFSKTGLDKGTSFFLETLLKLRINFNKKEIADYGAGWGAIALVVAREFPEAKITAYENDDASARAAEENLKNYKNVNIKRADLTKRVDGATKTFDYILSNPPFHITAEERSILFENADSSLKRGGQIIFVVEKSFAVRFFSTAKLLFHIIERYENQKYRVYQMKKIS